MEGHSRRMAHGYPRPARSPSLREQQSSISDFFCGAQIQRDTYVIDFCRVGRVVRPSCGEGPPEISIFRNESCGCRCILWDRSGRRGDQGFGSIARFDCMTAGRHFDRTPDSRRVGLCSRLPCGSYGAGDPIAVVRSHELASCGNGGTLLCS